MSASSILRLLIRCPLPACQHGDQLGRRRAETVGQSSEGLAQLADPVQRCVVLGTDRRHHQLGDDERVDRQQPEVRRRVDHHIVVLAEDRLKRVAQKAFATELADQAHLDPGQRRRGGDHVNAVDVADDRVRRGRRGRRARRPG